MAQIQQWFENPLFVGVAVFVITQSLNIAWQEFSKHRKILVYDLSSSTVYRRNNQTDKVAELIVSGSPVPSLYFHKLTFSNWGNSIISIPDFKNGSLGIKTTKPIFELFSETSNLTIISHSGNHVSIQIDNIDCGESASITFLSTEALENTEILGGIVGEKRRSIRPIEQERRRTYPKALAIILLMGLAVLLFGALSGTIFRLLGLSQFGDMALYIWTALTSALAGYLVTYHSKKTALVRLRRK